jgi:hypothetical protein
MDIIVDLNSESILREHTFTRGLDGPRLSKLASLTTQVTFVADEVILENRKQSLYFYLVTSGSVMVELRTPVFTAALDQADALLFGRVTYEMMEAALGILLIVAGVAYVAHSLTLLLLAGHRIILYERLTMLARAAGEFPIMLRLVIKSADPPR